MIKDAKWIVCEKDIGEVCPLFSKKFQITKPVKKATLYVSAIGLYNAFLNDIKVGNALFTPYWTAYKKRLQYQCYDVKDMLSKNCGLSIICGKGWAVGDMGWYRNKSTFSDKVAAIASLDIVFEDGSKEIITTDDSFDVYTSNILFSNIYDGETADFGIKPKKIGKAVITDEFEKKTKLIKTVGEDVVEQDKVFPVSYFVTKNGERVIDFGQNMTGYVEVKAHGKKGDKIKIKHFEVLDRDGNVYTASLRSAKQVCEYTLSGKEEICKPRFSFQGFRYIYIEDYPDYDVKLSDFTAVSVYSDIKRTGSFSCGVEKINQLYSNVIWGQKSNFLDVPTDCPQRDERLGWTGDVTVFCTTAAINFNVEKFFAKWLGDLACEQFENGAIPQVAPIPDMKCGQKISSGWGDVATVAPWQMYRAYGNKKILASEFPMMKKWVDYVHKDGPEEYLWLGASNYGDWLAPDADMKTLSGPTDKDLIASAFFYRSASLLVAAGKELGEDISEYEKMLPKIKAAFTKRFTKGGLPTSDTQTACALMIYFGLCDDVKKVAGRLVALIKENGMRLCTGFLGTPYLLPSLSTAGHSDVAYSLLLQEEYPSWLYSVNRGATTVWEHWDGINEKGDMWRVDMNSFNHYAYGSVFEWVYEFAAGIKPALPGYEKIIIEPHPDKRLGYINCGIDTVCGRVESNWRYTPVGDLIRFDIKIPKKSVADIILPDGRKFTLGGGDYTFHTKI